MSQIEVPKVLMEERVDKLQPGKDAPQWAWGQWRAMSMMMRSITGMMERFADVLGREIGFGNPHNNADLTNAESALDNVEGAWFTIKITAAAQLGAGASSPIVCTHGLNQPVQTTGGVANASLPNVRWLLFGVIHGEKNAPAAVPAAAANAAHTSVYFKLGDPVTADAISLRVHSDLTPSASDPIYIDLFFVRAVV